MLPHDDKGHGTPAIVLLHAGVADRSMWRELLAALEESHRVLALDLPGFGDAPPTVDAAPWHAVLETLDAAEVGRFVLVGCSFGAAVALRVAALAPSRIAGLLLCATPLPDMPVTDELAAIWEAEDAALASGDIGAAVDINVDAWLLPDASPDLRARVADMQRRAFLSQRGGPPPAEAPDPIAESPAALERLEAPIVVAVGALDRPEFRAAAEQLGRRLPGARVRTLTGAGHLPPLEAAAVFEQLVRELLGAAA